MRSQLDHERYLSAFSCLCETHWGPSVRAQTSDQCVLQFTSSFRPCFFCSRQISLALISCSVSLETAYCSRSIRSTAAVHADFPNFFWSARIRSYKAATQINVRDGTISRLMMRRWTEIKRQPSDWWSIDLLLLWNHFTFHRFMWSCLCLILLIVFMTFIYIYSYCCCLNFWFWTSSCLAFILKYSLPAFASSVQKPAHPDI